MACNCLTNQQINELYKRFGYGVKTTKGQTLGFRIKNFFVNTGVAICIVFITPFLFLYIVGNLIFSDGKISLRKFFRLKERDFNEYVEQQYRKQSDLQAKG